MVKVMVKDKIYAELEKPAIVYDNTTFSVLKIGEIEEMNEVVEYLKERYTKVGLHNMIDSLKVLKLPCDEELISKIFNRQGYLEIYLKEN